MLRIIVAPAVKMGPANSLSHVVQVYIIKFGRAISFDIIQSGFEWGIFCLPMMENRKKTHAWREKYYDGRNPSYCGKSSPHEN